MKRFITRTLPVVIAGILCIFGLSACAHREPVKKATPTQRQQSTLLQSIKHSGVQVIQQGSRLQMILPVDTFFDLASTQLRDYKIDTVQRVALYLQLYLQQFNKPVMIHVSGYSDTVYRRPDRLAVSNQYAQVIASYLWSHGFSEKQLRIIGFGSLHPIGNNKTTKGSGFNRRVMIQVN